MTGRKPVPDEVLKPLLAPVPSRKESLTLSQIKKEQGFTGGEVAALLAQDAFASEHAAGFSLFCFTQISRGQSSRQSQQNIVRDLSGSAETLWLCRVNRRLNSRF